jgi:hypothetical protein
MARFHLAIKITPQLREALDRLATADDLHLSVFARRVLVRHCIERGELPKDWKEERAS